MLPRAVGLSVLCAGCHVGAGPVIAYAPHDDVRLGFEVSGGYGPLRGSIGRTRSPVTGRGRTYATFDPGLAMPSNVFQRLEDWVGGGATLGVVGKHEDPGGQLAVGAWTAGSAFKECPAYVGAALVVSVAIGVRWLGGVTELYAAPKVGALTGCPSIGGD